MNVLVVFSVWLALICRLGECSMCSAGIFLTCGRAVPSKAATASCEWGCVVNIDDVVCPSDFVRSIKPHDDCLGVKDAHDYICTMPLSSVHKLDDYCAVGGAGPHTLKFSDAARVLAVRSALVAAGLQVAARAPRYSDQMSQRSSAQNMAPMLPQNNFYYPMPGSPVDESYQSGGSSQSMMMLAIVVLLVGLICLITSAFFGVGCYWFGKKSGIEQNAHNRYQVLNMKAGLEEQI